MQPFLSKWRIGMVAIIAAGGCGPPGPVDIGPDDAPAQSPQAVWREAFDPAGAGFMSSVWGSAPDDVFTVGGQPEQAAVFHYDGAAWTSMEVPELPIFVWVFGFGSDDVIAVGERGAAARYDGSNWQALDTGVDADLFGVWGAMPDDLWAVGGNLAEGPPLILHFNGGDWTEVALPQNDRNPTALLKVWGTSADNVFAVGQNGIILHYDGSAWRQVASGTSADLISLWGSAPNQVLSVGGRASARMSVYDGDAWQSHTSPLPGLNGVFVPDAGTAVVVGLLGTAATVDLSTVILTPETTPTALTLHAVWGDGAGRTYAVGGRSSERPYTGVAIVRTME